MPKSPHDKFSIATRVLINVAPAEWDTFINLFKTYTGEHMEALLTCPADQFLNKQGHAQALIKLLEHFENAQYAEPKQD